MRLIVAVCLAAAVLWGGARAAGEPAGEWEVTLASRQLDLTTHQARQTVTLTLSNAGKTPLTTFLFTVDASLSGKVAHVGAHVSTN